MKKSTDEFLEQIQILNTYFKEEMNIIIKEKFDNITDETTFLKKKLLIGEN